jgi:hypothetical protein
MGLRHLMLTSGMPIRQAQCVGMAEVYDTSVYVFCLTEPL